MDNSIREDSEQLRRIEKQLKEAIAENETQYEELKAGSDYKKLHKVKSTLDSNKVKLLNIQTQIKNYDNVSQNILEAQKLDSNLETMQETNNKKLKELKIEQDEQLREIEAKLKREYEETELDLNNKFLTKVKKSTEALDLEKKIFLARKKEDWQKAGFYDEELKKVNAKDEELSWTENKKMIKDKLFKLKNLSEKKMEKERTKFQRIWNEKKIELQNAYDNILKNSMNMQKNNKSDQKKLMNKTLHDKNLKTNIIK